MGTVMVEAMVKSKLSIVNKSVLIAVLIAPGSMAVSAELKITPKASLEHVFSDNVTLQHQDKKDSLISFLRSGVNINYLSPKANMALDYEKSLANYTHNHDLDDNFDQLSFTSSFVLYPDGLSLISNASISNVSTNNIRNSLADTVSGDTTEQRNFDIGLQYFVTNSSFNIASQYIYSESKSDDNLGEREGYTANIISTNGNNSRYVFWDLKGNYNDFNNGRSRSDSNNQNYLDGLYYSIDHTLGLITSYRINPFIRYYKEKSEGNIDDNNSLGSDSVGAGLRMLLSKNSRLDVAYNWAEDSNDNNTGSQEEIDDYISASLTWKPSKRTNLLARYYQRFYGDAYEFQFDHKMRRLTSTISYTESIELFDRYEYEQGETSEVWCLTSAPNDLSRCIVNPGSGSNLNDYYFAGTNTEYNAVEANQFILNKNLQAGISLKTKRTVYSIDFKRGRRENINTSDTDHYDSFSFSITRKTSRTSNLDLSFTLNKNNFDNNDSNYDNQEDYYRSYNVNFNKKIKESLSMNLSIYHLNRNSNRLSQTYEENRALISLTKEF